jgi:PhnB protein
MEKAFKPQGYNSLSPYLIVDGAQQLIAFLQELFGAKELRRFNRPDGKVMHAEVQIDDSIIMLSDATENYAPATTILHLYVPDAETTYNKAISLGCTSIEAPSCREGDPDMRGTFSDFAGNMWSVGTQVNTSL